MEFWGKEITKPERIIEAEILQYLNIHPNCMAWKNVSGGFYDSKKRCLRPHVSKYAINGTADILGIYKGKPLAIEVKSKKGKLTVHQAAFLKRFVEMGGVGVLARSLEDVKMVLSMYESQGVFKLHEEVEKFFT